MTFWLNNSGRVRRWCHLLLTSPWLGKWMQDNGLVTARFSLEGFSKRKSPGGDVWLKQAAVGDNTTQ
ncbi:hypothetical protein KCP69_05695 [Salmonella enterica subsp. enterica]|nr:hypothetical protein KCP69_05695 [Salmonella enterica subsp. enterica]